MRLAPFLSILLLMIPLFGCDGGHGGRLAATTTTTAPAAGGSTTTMITMLTSTTSTTTTTTTMPGPPPVQTSGSIEISVTSSGTIGALQFDVDYSGIDGSFDGSADSVECSSPLSSGGALVTFNDDDGNKRLRVGVVSLAGFNAPVVAAECIFTVQGTNFAAPGDFDVIVNDASTPELTPITATMAVTAATPF